MGTLNRKYEMEDARAKKFIVSQFLDYKKIDFKIMIGQVQEIQGTYTRFTQRAWC